MKAKTDILSILNICLAIYTIYTTVDKQLSLQVFSGYLLLDLPIVKM